VLALVAPCALVIVAMVAGPATAQSPSTEVVPQKVIFDTDMVELFDDGAAMLLLDRAPNIDLLGVTVVAGNTTMPRGVATGVRQLEAIGSEVPIYAGSRFGFRYWRATPEGLTAEEVVSPVTSYGGYLTRIQQGLPATDMDTDPMAEWTDVYQYLYEEAPTYANVYGLGHPDASGNQDAVDFLVDTVDKNPGEVTIVAVGPLTNIARAILKDPTLPSKTKQMVYMGGSFYLPGNSSATAEFNWWADPDAAKLSVRAKWGDPASETFASYGNQVIAGLEANENTGGMPEDLYRQMVDSTFPGIQELWLAREQRLRDQGRETFGPGNVWDLFAAAYVIDPSIVLSWNNEPRPEDGVPQPISGVYIDVDSEMGINYGRSTAFSDDEGPVGAQKAAIQSFIDEDKFWTEIVVPLHADPAQG
jgi:inosine-uridine nucleoside N-ribohydrolase